MTTSTTLIRNLRVGDRLSFDGGRITLTLEDKSGRGARLRLLLAKEVLVDKFGAKSDNEKKHTLI